MVRTRFHRSVLAAAACAALAACGGGTTDGSSDEEAAESEEPAVIAERQANLKGLGDAFKTMRGELEKPEPDLTIVGTQAETMNASATKIAEHFPAGTGIDDGFDTEALASIWEKPDDFASATQRLVDTTGAMITVAGEGKLDAVGAQVGEIGLSCKGCHDDFRLDTD